MTFDERLRHSFETLGDRLRDEITRELRTLSDELSSAAEADRETAAVDAANAAREEGKKEGRKEGSDEGKEEGRTEGLAAGREEGRTEGLAAGREEGRAEGLAAGREEGRAEGLAAGREEGRTEGHAAGREEGRKAALEEGREEGRAEAREAATEEARIAAERSRQSIDAELEAARNQWRASEIAASERLIESIRNIDTARSLSEILDTVVKSASREAARAGVFLVRNERLRGWRFAGFGSRFDSPNEIDLAVDDGGVIADAMRTGAAALRGSSPRIADLAAGRDATAVPILVSGQIVAVLYGDLGPSHPDSTGPNPQSETVPNWTHALELIARHAARCLEALTAFQTARVQTVRTGVSGPA